MIARRYKHLDLTKYKTTNSQLYNNNGLKQRGSLSI